MSAFLDSFSILIVDTDLNDVYMFYNEGYLLSGDLVRLFGWKKRYYSSTGWKLFYF